MVIVLVWWIVVCAVVAGVAIGFAWPAWHIARRWGQWALASTWFTASLILALLFRGMVEQRMRMMGILARHREEYASFAKLLPLTFIALGAVALVVDYKQRLGEARFSIRIALLCAAVFVAAAFLALVLNRVAYIVFMGI